MRSVRFFDDILDRIFSHGVNVRSYGWARSIATFHRSKSLLQLRVLRFGLLQDRNVRVGVFPEDEQIFVGCERRTHAASVSAPGEVLACKALARATPRYAKAPVQQFQTIPLWSRIFWNSDAASLHCPAARYPSPRMYT